MTVFIPLATKEVIDRSRGDGCIIREARRWAFLNSQKLLMNPIELGFHRVAIHFLLKVSLLVGVGEGIEC